MKVISRLRDLKMSISATSVHIYFVYMNEASQVTEKISDRHPGFAIQRAISHCRKTQ